MEIVLEKTLHGRILDVGGGGEGIIGRVYGEQVTAIDKHRDELDEAPANGRKLVMDACDLKFPNASFDHVTFFYTLMFMAQSEWPLAFAEAGRVLRPQGDLLVWDVNIDTAYPNPFSVHLSVDCAGQRVNTTYGIVKAPARQDAESVLKVIKAAGFACHGTTITERHFYLHFKKKE